MCVQMCNPLCPEEGIGSLGPGVAGVCELSAPGFWDLNSISQDKQQALLTA